MVSDKVILTSKARIWEESTPVGNGRMGITLQGGVVNIYIVAIFTRDESIATPIIEPFNSALHNSNDG
jgi:hypothetical protein